MQMVRKIDGVVGEGLIPYLRRISVTTERHVVVSFVHHVDSPYMLTKIVLLFERGLAVNIQVR